jgi:hypothetical protein
LTTGRERRSAVEREKTHYTRAGFQPAAAHPCRVHDRGYTSDSGCWVGGRVPESRPKLAPEGMEGGVVDRGSEPAHGGVRVADHERRLSGQDDTANWNCGVGLEEACQWAHSRRCAA